jgi:hypothetical protein
MNGLALPFWAAAGKISAAMSAAAKSIFFTMVLLVFSRS